MPATALASMVTEAARVAPLETGGVLLGYCVGLREIIVVQSIGPGPKAVHAKTRFAPDADFHEHAVAEVYSGSGRRYVYVGDWHSHPNGDLELSKSDRRVLKSIATAAEARMAFPIMAILGGPTTSKLSIWRYIGYERLRHKVGRAVEKCAVHLYERTAGERRNGESTNS